MSASIWGVIVIAIAIVAVTLILKGGLTEGVFLSVLFFILIGALVPTVAVPVGLIILLAIFLKNNGGGKLFGYVQSLPSRKGV